MSLTAKTEILIKKAVVTDIPRICRFLQAMGPDFPDNTFQITRSASFIVVFTLLLRTILFNRFNEKLIGYFSETVIASHSKSVVGIAYFGKKHNTATIHGIAVKENFRKKGVGTSLLRNIIILCQKQKVNLIQLYTLRRNPTAISLYQTVGFHVNENISSDLRVCMQRRFQNNPE